MKRTFLGVFLGICINELFGFILLKRHPKLEKQYWKAIDKEKLNLMAWMTQR